MVKIGNSLKYPVGCWEQYCSGSYRGSFYLFERILLMLVTNCQIMPSIYFSSMVSIYDIYSWMDISGPGCSESTTSLVNEIVSWVKYCHYFFRKRVKTFSVQNLFTIFQ